MKRVLTALLGTSFLVAAPAFSQSAWIHVEVEESKDAGDNTHVKVNLPLSVVEIALEAAPSKVVSDGHIHIHHADHDIEIEDLRRMWRELREAGDAELVSITGDDAKVDVQRRGDRVTIDVTERDGDRDNVHIELPVAVMDALFSGEGEELNVRDAVRELKSQRGEIVRVDGGDAQVRVWIDEKE